MNEKNFEYLRDQVKFTGFGEGLEADLKQKLQEQPPAFSLNHQTRYGNDTVSTTLQFSRSKQSDMYFFNSYQVTLQKETASESMIQTFYLNKGNNITLKEAYNLMNGRSVNKDLTNKEGQLYNTWLQMDFKESDDKGNFKLKQYHQNYGYDLESAIAKLPIKELTQDEQKAMLMDSLKKGNLQSVTFQKDGQELKQYIEANPQYKTINVYSSSMQRLGSRQVKAENRDERQGQSINTADNKERQGPAEEDIPGLPQEKKKRKKQSIS